MNILPCIEDQSKFSKAKLCNQFMGRDIMDFGLMTKKGQEHRQEDAGNDDVMLNIHVIFANEAHEENMTA